MDDIYAIRLKNLTALLASPTLAGKLQKEQALALNLGSSMLSQLTAGKKIGDDVARKIEQAQKLPQNWMDNAHDAAPASQPGRLDAEIVRATFNLLRDSYADEKKEFDLAAEPDLFAIVYERMAQSGGRPKQGELVRIGQVIEKRQQGDTGDGSRGAGEAGGTDQAASKERAVG